ncbi:hypothetical protein LTR53_007703 [Teratosphaeriaceae sp. CCFEE 6253]|nr:hypothetical protein LTR53_007703 [Teratosphaeriaceae sp. CCFEE 6253]
MGAQPQMALRAARRADLDEVAAVSVAAWSGGKQWAYRYPCKDSYPEDNYRHVKQNLDDYIGKAEAGTHDFLVIESTSAEDADAKKIIAYGVWDKPHTGKGKAIPGGTPHFQRRDGHPARMAAFKKATSQKRQELFVAKFEDRQMSLRHLATHPDYRRRGAGSMVLQWGFERAREQGVAITMFATEVGEPLYERHGFKVLDRIRIQVEGEEEYLMISCMAWEAEGFAMPGNATPSVPREGVAGYLWTPLRPYFDSVVEWSHKYRLFPL